MVALQAIHTDIYAHVRVDETSILGCNRRSISKSAIIVFIAILRLTLQRVNYWLIHFYGKSSKRWSRGQKDQTAMPIEYIHAA